jgi:predicted phage terminase large subunit-like protein
MNLIERDRVKECPQIVRRVVAVDPAITNTDSSDETGIIVASRDHTGNGYVEHDYSMKGRPDAWATRVVEAYDAHQCDAIVIEVNQGGDLVAQVLRTIRPSLPIREVRASQGKKLRAEPISAMYEQGRIHHVGHLATLEDQMTSWTPDLPKSPDRLDALVWALTDLMEAGGAEAYIRALANMCGCGYPNRIGINVCLNCGKDLNAPIDQ